MQATNIEQLNNELAGRYLIEREIGRGGMATVYVARDLRHDRRVAIKILLAELGAVLGPERFLSEIRVTANLQHPNLLPLFDSGEAGDRLYYVMPYVDGESLRQRLQREKQIPVDEAIRMTTACAGALDYAHRNNVVHRDLKPENILLSAGQPVIADFGIALAVSKAGGARVTQSGLSLGTPQYMSPEQAAGDRDVDGRSDIYSMACVLYEMLTGDPPHTGSTVQAVIAKVLVEKPRSVRSQRERVPEHVEAAIDRALAKIPADRWATAGQFCDALNEPYPKRNMGSRTAEGDHSYRYARASRGTRARRFAWPVATIAAAAVAGTAWLGNASSTESPLVQFVVPTTADAPLAVDPSTVLFSPDGRSIVYAATVRNQRSLFVRNLADLSAREIRGTAGASLPFFSPDGKWIAFAAEDGIIYKVAASGGNPVRIAQTTEWRGGTWNQNGDIVFGGNGGLSRVPATGGSPQMFTERDTTQAERGHIQPMFLPDGRTIVFRIEDRTSRANDRLAVASLDKRGHQLLGIRGGNPLALIDGRLVFGRPGGILAAVPFDARRRKPSGEAVVLLDEVSVWAGAAASLAPDGSLVYVKSGDASRLTIADDRSTEITTATEQRRYARPRLSPDGRTIAVELSSGGANRSDIWAYDVASGVLSRITTQATSEQPEWTPDGRNIIYLRDDGGKFAIWKVPADASGPEERLYAAPNAIREVTISPDGGAAVFRVDDVNTGRDLWLLPLSSVVGDRRATPFLASTFNELSPRISPDGRWVTYISDESGRYEVYVRSFPGRGPRLQVSVNGGTEPLWTANGSRIVYRSGGKFVAATVVTAEGITVAQRQELFDDAYRSSHLHPQYDVDRTGKRYVLLKPIGGAEIIVMLKGLKALAGAAEDR